MRSAAFVLCLLSALAGCRGCAGPEAPDEYAVGRIVDPYERVPAGGTQVDRAKAVLDDVSEQLGYGTVPGEVLARHQNEAWAQRIAALLAYGGTEQLSAAWSDLRLSVTEGLRTPSELKMRTRQAEARVYALENEGADEETLRHAYLAEIAWVLVLQDRYQKVAEKR